MDAAPYPWLRFLFKIDSIKPSYKEIYDFRDPSGYWIPPDEASEFQSLSTTGWWLWTPDGMAQATTSPNTEDFQVSSLFFNSENHHFVGVPFDCREASVRNYMRTYGVGWRRVMFDYREEEGRQYPISVMSFDRQEHVLAAQGSNKWMPQLIPASYSSNQPDRPPGITGLAGDLALILAFAAFSGPFDQVLGIISRSFAPPTWRTHFLHPNREHGSGVVVSVRVDPQAPVATAEILTNFQNGDYGPIIAP